MDIYCYINNIKDIDYAAGVICKKRWDSLAKPLKGLGKLENAVSKIAAIQHSCNFIDISKPALLIMCADHGVVAENVTQTGSEITKKVTDSFQNSNTTVTIMAKCANVDVFPVDVGIDCDDYFNKELLPFKVAGRKVKRGTENIKIKNAMTLDECKKAIITGIECVKELKNKGYNIIATGEMGIGNTTPSSVLAGILFNMSAESVTGKGAGLSNEGLENKKRIVNEVIKRVKNECCVKNTIELLSACGGIEIAAMCGVFIGGGVYGVPVIADGFISLMSAVTAIKIAPKCKDYILGSHISAETACKIAAKKAEVDVFVDCDMCIGEGTGAVAVIPLLNMAAKVYNEMDTFDGFGMERYKNFDE